MILVIRTAEGRWRRVRASRVLVLSDNKTPMLCIRCDRFGTRPEDEVIVTTEAGEEQFHEELSRFPLEGGQPDVVVMEQTDFPKIL